MSTLDIINLSPWFHSKEECSCKEYYKVRNNFLSSVPSRCLVSLDFNCKIHGTKEKLEVNDKKED